MTMTKKIISPNDFKKFMKSFTAEGNSFTHVGMLEGTRARYAFNRQGIEELYDIIGNNPNLLYGLAENHKYILCSD